MMATDNTETKAREFEMYTLFDARRMSQDQISSHRGKHQAMLKDMRDCPMLPVVLETTVFHLWQVKDFKSVPMEDVLAIPRYLAIRFPHDCREYRYEVIKRWKAKVLALANIKAAQERLTWQHNAQKKNGSSKKTVRFHRLKKKK
jgi:hypothetical protein